MFFGKKNKVCLIIKNKVGETVHVSFISLLNKLLIIMIIDESHFRHLKFLNIKYFYSYSQTT